MLIRECQLNSICQSNSSHQSNSICQSNLGGNIIRCSAESSRGISISNIFFTHSEISDFNVTFTIQHDIVKFQIPKLMGVGGGGIYILGVYVDQGYRSIQGSIGKRMQCDAECIYSQTSCYRHIEVKGYNSVKKYLDKDAQLQV